MLAWLGLALLSASWLFGLGYFHLPSTTSQQILIAGGTALLATARLRAPRLGEMTLASLLLAPVALFMPWPYCYGPVLVIAATLGALVAVVRGADDEVPPFGFVPSITMIVLLALGVLLADSANRAAAISFAVAVGLCLIPIKYSLLSRFFGGGALAGCILLSQSAAIYAYESFTAWSHELPAPLPKLLEWLAERMGIDAAATDTTLTVRSMRLHSELGATWELFCDPASFCFIAGALLLLAWTVWSEWPVGARWSRLVVGAALLLATMAIWLPIRAVAYVAIYLDAVLRLDFDAPLTSVRLLWNHWIHLALLTPVSLLAWRLVTLAVGVDGSNSLPQVGGAMGLGGAPSPQSGSRADLPPAVADGVDLRSFAFDSTTRNMVSCLAAAVAMFTLMAVWDPPGVRKGGRVLVEEFHPPNDKMWERTDKPFDTTWYGHLAGYNYYAIYDYCSKFYQMSRLGEPITAESLANIDVLMVKVPTHEFQPEEINAIVNFVADGGGLMLVGEHTNVFGSGAFLNPIARHFGFSFRYDSLFGVDRVFDESFEPSCIPHPIVQHVPSMEFATSCSIAPAIGGVPGHTVIRGLGLKSLDADYHISNFYPPPDDQPQMRYGAFVQLYAARYGKGRVVGFTDSTIFSNFCTFEPGKPELMLGMLEWLNHGGNSDLRPLLFSIGACLAIAAIAMLTRWRASPLVLVAVAAFGWAAAGQAARAWHAWSMPLPAIRSGATLVRVGVDQHLCRPKLPKAGFVDGKPNGFGIFERWILRLGYFTMRYPQRHFRDESTDEPTATDASAREFDDDLLATDLALFCYPSQSATPTVRQKLLDYVNRGGKILVLDSGRNRASTANELLEPFGLSLASSKQIQGQVEFKTGWKPIAAEAVLPVTGGAPLATIRVPPAVDHPEPRDVPVAATVRIGRGTVTVVGFGDRFSDAHMGVTGDVEPGEELMTVYDAEFGLVRGIIKDALLGPAVSDQP